MKRGRFVVGISWDGRMRVCEGEGDDGKHSDKSFSPFVFFGGDTLQ